METVAAISQAKGSNPFTKGVHGRDLAAKLLIPKHITAKWQHKCGELREVKLKVVKVIRLFDHTCLTILLSNV